MFSFTACEKTVTVKEFPNYLFKIDLTPGEEEKEVSVFLYCTKEIVETEIITKGDENQYRILLLNNTFKASGINKLSVDGLEGLLEKAMVVQYINRGEEIDEIKTKIVFNLKDPETIITPIIHYVETENKNVEKAMKKNGQVSEFLGAPEEVHDNSFLIGILIFWGFIVGGLILYYFLNKLIVKK
jgi:hypothetical protein